MTEEQLNRGKIIQSEKLSSKMLIESLERGNQLVVNDKGGSNIIDNKNIIEAMIFGITKYIEQLDAEFKNL